MRVGTQWLASSKKAENSYSLSGNGTTSVSETELRLNGALMFSEQLLT
jgi:hypothetical protein